MPSAFTVDGYWSRCESNLLRWGRHELAPIPEPATIIGALAFVGLIVLRERRRISVLLKRMS